MPRHFFERNSLRRFRVANDAAGVVVRNKALGNYVEERDRYQEEHAANQHRQRAVLEHELQGPAIAAHQPIVNALARLPPLATLCRGRGHPARIFITLGALPHRPTPAGLPGRGPRSRATAPMANRLQQAAAKHRRQTQGDKSRNQNRDADRDCEFAKQASQDSAQKQHRNENRHQRYGHRNDRESDFARALERGFHRAFAVFHAAHDVFQHHDRVIDDETHGQRQGHQRKIVETETQQIHHRERENDRCGQRQRGNDRRAHVAEKQEDDEHDQGNCQQQRQLHIIHRLAN